MSNQAARAVASLVHCIASPAAGIKGKIILKASNGFLNSPKKPNKTHYPE